MINFDWKSTGWLITKKLAYYFLVVTILSISATYALSLMTAANTILFILGGLLFVLATGVGLTLTIRECFFYINKFDK